MNTRTVNKKPCPKCKKLFHPGILWRHEKFCGNNTKERKIDDNWKQKNGMYKCPYCNDEFSVYGIMLHIYKKHTDAGKNQDPNIGYKTGKREAWNKGMETGERIRKKISNSLKGKNGRSPSEQTRKKISIARIQAIKEGKTSRWQSISGRSYPEKYFEKYLINEGFIFETQYHINDGKRNYFLDFYFPEYKINLEIDGSQHEWPERIESDRRRDDFLRSNGIKVIRIKWGDPKKKDVLCHFREKIKEIKK